MSEALTYKQRPFILTSSRNKTGQFCVHVHVQDRRWERCFDDKVNAQAFMCEWENSIITVLRKANLESVTDGTFELLDSIFKAPVRPSTPVRIYLVFSHPDAIQAACDSYAVVDESDLEALKVCKLTVPVDSGYVSVLCVLRPNLPASREVPLLWHSAAEAIYRHDTETDVYTALKERGRSFETMLRAEAANIVAYTGKFGMRRTDKLRENVDPKSDDRFRNVVAHINKVLPQFVTDSQIRRAKEAVAFLDGSVE